MKNGTTVICTNIFKGKTEEEIKKRFNICIAKIIQRESLAYSEIGQITQIDNTVKRNSFRPFPALVARRRIRLCTTWTSQASSQLVAAREKRP